MLKIIYFFIILYIVGKQYFERNVTQPKNNKINKEKMANNYSSVPSNTYQSRERIIQPNSVRPPIQSQTGEKVWDFDKPNPWSKIILRESAEYPYNFYIKLKIPSLNDYQNWKQVVPNIDFMPQTGELIIPSKDEPSALALANLISSNFSGLLSLEDILQKNLIQISISKAKTHEIVQKKLREQILETLYGSQDAKVQNSFEKELSKPVDFTSEQFTDTFQHFSDASDTQKDGTKSDIEPFDGLDFSYIN